ncbi:MAG: S8 family peptidase [Lacrimispora sp.]|uniref:S8 family peptidase n=1 Tax=Lacrimispora sp. TaxID=2719234 RepID=UPI0039E4360E
MEKILDNNYYDLIVNNLLISSFGENSDVTPLNDRLSLVHVSAENMQPCDLGLYPYHLFPSIYIPTAAIDCDSNSIGTTQPAVSEPFYGNDIIVGVVDTGIDYRHPAFLNTDHTTRILSIWDQTIQEGLPPYGFTFGTEYTSAHINEALGQEDPLSVVPSTDILGHGSAIASIAAGTPNPERAFTSVVPKADLAVVKLKEAKNSLKKIFCVPEDKICFQESDIVLGIRYLVSVAQKLKKPIVICVAMGSSQGSHDGLGVLSGYLDTLVQFPKTGFSVSAGNEADNKRHYYNETLSPPFLHEFQLNIGKEDREFAMELWTQVPGRLSIEIASPNQETTPFFYPTFDKCYHYEFQNSSSQVIVNNMIFERNTGDQLILLRFKNPLPGIWHLLVQSTENEPFSFHSWLPAGNLISDKTFFLSPNPDTTITAPANSRHAMAVTAYNQITGNILDESSRGYSRKGLVKPNIAAPGYQIPCALPGGEYGTLTGTGAGAASAAGAVAVLFQWTQATGHLTDMAGEQASRLLIRGARRSSAFSYPNNIWGNGMLDLYNTLERILLII